MNVCDREKLYEKVAAEIDSTLEGLKKFNATPNRGITRLPFTKEALAAADYLEERMRQAGMKTRRDESGAVIGRLTGSSGKTILIGSHYDTVRHGGAYDGMAGIACGIEAARLLQAIQPPLRHSLEVIATNDEEGARFRTGFFSSKAMSGELAPEHFREWLDNEGISLYDAMMACGLKPEDIWRAKRDPADLAAFLEVHVEQGPVLEIHNKEIGIVDGIVGIRRAMITISGRADHAGTTPMGMRRDAMDAAAKIVVAIGETARHYRNAVATVGSIRALPGEVNVICEEVRFSLDVRAEDEKTLEEIMNEIDRNAKGISSREGVGYRMDVTLATKPAFMDADLRQMLEHICTERGLSTMHLSSGAGHDCLVMAGITPSAMLFVPSKGGRSHCPEEYSDSGHLAKAVFILRDVIIKMEEEWRV